MKTPRVVVVGGGVVVVVPAAPTAEPGEPATPNFMAPVPDWCAPTSGVATPSLKFGIFVPLP